MIVNDIYSLSHSLYANPMSGLVSITPLLKVRAWLGNYIALFYVYVITYHCSDLDAGLAILLK